MKIKIPFWILAGSVVVLGGIGLVLLVQQEKAGGPSPVINNQQNTQEFTGNLVEVEMVARQFSFEPNTIRVKRGDKVRLKIKSVDVVHGLALPDFGVNEVLEPGKEVTVEFVATEKGTFPFICSIYCGAGHSSMRGQLIVE